MKNRYLIPLLFVLSSPAFAAAEDSASSLSLASYLEQVSKDNPAIRASRTNKLGYDLAAREPEAAFSPSLTGDVNYLDNKAESAMSAISGNRMRITNWDLGLSKLWGTGTYTTIGYKASNTLTDYPAADPLVASNPMIQQLMAAFEPSANPYYQSAPSLMISQSLLKNFMARGATVTLDKVQTQAKAGKVMEGFAIQQAMFSAETTYVQLAVARSAVAIQEESLVRNQKILEWAKRRAASNLGDQVDVLQTLSAVKQLEMGLTQSREDAKAAARAFNVLRGLPENAPVGELEVLEPPTVKTLVRKGDRADVAATKLDLQSRQLAVDEVIERYKPDLSVFGSVSLNGFSGDPYNAWGKSTTTDYTTTMVGAKLTANIDFPLIFKVIEGAKLATVSGDDSLRQKKAELDRDWANLLEKWIGVQERLAMAEELEALQKDKAEREKVRFSNGRTTNFQVLRFEDDYAQARLMHLRLIADSRITEAQARLYNGE